MGNEQSNSNSEPKPTEGEYAVSNEPPTKERDQRRRAAYENRSRRNTFQMPSPVEQKYAKKVQVQVPLTKIRFSIEERVDEFPNPSENQADEQQQQNDEYGNIRSEQTDKVDPKYLQRVKKNTKKCIKRGKKAILKSASTFKRTTLFKKISNIKKLTYGSLFHDSRSQHEASHDRKIGVEKSPWKGSDSSSTISPRIASCHDRMSTHRRSHSPDSSSVESSIAARVKNIQIGATRASYGNRRAPNLQIRSSSQGSSFGSFESQSNPYGGTGGLRLDKIVSICSTISDDFTPRQKRGGPKIDRAVLSVINPSFQSFDEQSHAMPETPLGFDHLAEYDYHENLLKLQSTPASECSEAMESNYYFESRGLPTASKRESVSQKSPRDSQYGSSLLEKYLMTKRSMKEQLASEERHSIDHCTSNKSATSSLPAMSYKANRSTGSYSSTQNSHKLRGGVDDASFDGNYESGYIRSRDSDENCFSEEKNQKVLKDVQEEESVDDSSIPLYSKKIEYSKDVESVMSNLTNSIANFESFDREKKIIDTNLLVVQAENDTVNENDFSKSQMPYNESSSSDIRERVKGAQKDIIGYSPRAFGPKGMAFGVQLRRIDNPTINTTVPLIGDGVFPDETDDINQSRVDQPQAPVTGTDRASEMRTLLPVSNFSNPPTPKNNNSPSLNLFRTSFERSRSKESLENISENTRLAVPKSSPIERGSSSEKNERKSLGMVAQRVSEINKRASEGQAFAKGVTEFNGRLKKNRNVKYRNERRETNGEGVLAPRKGNLKNPLFCTPSTVAPSISITECDEEEEEEERKFGANFIAKMIMVSQENFQPLQSQAVNEDSITEDLPANNASSADQYVSHKDVVPESVQPITLSTSVDSTVDLFDQELTRHIEDLEEAMDNLETENNNQSAYARSEFISPKREASVVSYNEVESVQGSVMSDAFAFELANGFVGKKVLLGDFDNEESDGDCDDNGAIIENGGILPPRPTLLRSLSLNSATRQRSGTSASGYNSFGECSPLSMDNIFTPRDRENSPSLTSPPLRMTVSRTPYQASKWRQMAAKHGTAEKSTSKKSQTRGRLLVLEKM